LKGGVEVVKKRISQYPKKKKKDYITIFVKSYVHPHTGKLMIAEDYGFKAFPITVPKIAGKSKKSTVDEFQCERCGHKWSKRKRNIPPLTCPKCKSREWDVPK
jgi:rubrerythrin